MVFGTLITILGIYGLFNPQGGSAAITFVLTLNGTLNIEIMPTIFAGLLIISLLCVFIPMMKATKKMEHLLDVGKTATVKILDVQDTKYTVEDSTYAKITVESINGQKANSLFYVRKTDLPKPGEKIDILYDPADPTIIMVT